MHGSKTTARRKRSWFTVVIGLDGRPCGRHPFPTKGAALRWIEREGTALFKGKAERVELYNGRKVLMYAKELT
jgi:hypothetical protein